MWVLQLTQQKLKGLEAQRDQCELVQAQLSSCLDYVQGSLKTGCKGEILAMKVPVLKQIKQITAKFVCEPNILASEQEADLQLLTDDTLYLRISCQGCAKIVTGHSVCHSKSYATGDGLKVATVGEESTVTLHARDRDDRECDAPLQDINASLVCTSESTTVRCDIKWVGKSTYTVSYQPTTRGRHELYLKVNGKVMKGSPHNIIVRPNLKNPAKVIPGLNRPWGVTTDSKGRIIVTEFDGHCVSIFSPQWDKIQSLGSGSRSLTEGQFNYPAGVTVDNDDNIYIVDYGNRRIQKFSSNGRFLASVRTFGSTPSQLTFPLGIGFNKKNGKLYVCDRDNNRIQTLGTDLTLHFNFGRKGIGYGEIDYPDIGYGEFHMPYNIAFDRRGIVYVADYSNHRVQVFTPEGQYLRMFGIKGTCASELFYPAGIAVDGDQVYVAEYANHRISVFSTEGKFLKLFGHRGSAIAEFQCPHSVHVNKDGFILIADHKNNRIQVY